MPKRRHTHEGLLMINAVLLLSGQREMTAEVRHLCSLDLTSGAGPCWYLLRGAMLAVANVGERHPQRRDLRLALERAILLARAEGMPLPPPVYTGGQVRNFSKDA